MTRDEHDTRIREIMALISLGERERDLRQAEADREHTRKAAGGWAGRRRRLYSVIGRAVAERLVDRWQTAAAAIVSAEEEQDPAVRRVLRTGWTREQIDADAARVTRERREMAVERLHPLAIDVGALVGAERMESDGEQVDAERERLREGSAVAHQAVPGRAPEAARVLAGGLGEEASQGEALLAAASEEGLHVRAEGDGRGPRDGVPVLRDAVGEGLPRAAAVLSPARCRTCGNARGAGGNGCPECAPGNQPMRPRPQPAPVAPTTEERPMTTQSPETRAEAPRAAMAHPSDFGPEHMRIVREAFAAGASQPEFEVMWAGAKARGLDPVKKQIFFIKRYDSLKGGDVWASQVSIDGFRSIAVSSRHYDGQDEPEYEYDADGRLSLARVRVWRKGVSRPFVGVARWNEYVQTKKGGDPTHMWAKMEHTMLGKCAEALGLRKAFPEELGGLYSQEEMDQSENPSPPAEWRQEPKAALPPAVLTARDMLDRIGRAESAEPLFVIIKQARTWPKVRGNAWLRLLALADSPSAVEEAATLFEADDLPAEIVAKLTAAAQERAESFAPVAA